MIINCSNTTLESLNTWTYKQYDSRLGFPSGAVGDPTRPPSFLDGLAVVASSIPDRDNEGSRSLTTWASTGATSSIPSFKSISAFNSVHAQAGLAELLTGLLQNSVVRVTAGVA